MRDFYAASKPTPLDQADGLRRLFHGQAGPRQRVLALAANPHVAFSGVVLDRLAAVLAAGGRQVLVADAGAGAPAPNELSGLNLAVCIERIAPRVGYLPARGLPMAYVDTRGSASGYIDALLAAAPWADVVLLHAESAELARVLVRRAARPLLIGADHPESIKHAYATAKLLVRRCGLMSFDLLLAAAPHSPRLEGISKSLSKVADDYLGAWIHHTAVIDPAGDPAEPADEALNTMLAGQLTLDESPHWEGALAAGRGSVASPARPLNRTAY